ncbi:hypothetical protein [Streptomyces yangpuensis]|uniref:hypothetical protein n=1 Tax=Streptomyces yangpuensis TaxID=1648182 RepID=UPI000629750A|nr:hypothetical protein [Streptomyces yangpuensis]
MTGNPAIHAVVLAAATLLLLPLPVMLLRGRVPERLRNRAVARAYAYAMLGLYVQACLNTVPRMLDAPAGLTTACTAAGVGLAVAAAVLFMQAAVRGHRANPEGPR